MDVHMRGVLAILLCLSMTVSAMANNSDRDLSWPVVYPPAKPDWPVVYPGDAISILLAGDTGFGGHGQPVRDGFGMRHGRRLSFDSMTDGIAGLLNVDAAFANLETVVTDHNRLRPAGKRFVFRSHPSSIRHLTSLGFNLFSTSNNHVGDYGRAGIQDTLDHLEALSAEGRNFVAAGIGKNRQHAVAPKRLIINNAKLYLSAIGIGGGNANRRGAPDRAGHLHYRSRQDFEDVLAALGKVDDGYRMLSVHYGEESEVYTSRRDIIRLRDKAVRDAKVDLVIGHHAHVARGVARVDDKLILYGLGNFMHPGMQNMAKFDRCRDFGLVVKVHLGRVAQNRYRAMALEAIPITDMHANPRVMQPKQAQIRIGVLNGLARSLDDPEHNSEGVRFSARQDGTGVACFDGAEHMSGVIGRLCGVGAPTDLVRTAAAPAISCAGRRYRGASYAKGRKYSKRRKRKKQKANYFNPFGF